ncbi:hypothetical protein UFOVP125_7 [uncultured Caudovirales phage]|uniref:Uncharacterized protein n=1 Tax=uncultured Caudovirales phage TaxID=2100421 RepID=A0A6J5LFE2_9CAUD|nr:hypothetical protein UFOVP125_7 [uncultured Caudovirales phage]
MADLTQSSATTATTAPDWYTSSMKNLAAGASQYGVGGANAPAYVGAQPLQTAAFDATKANVGNFQPGLNTAGTMIGQGANVDITGAANPYLQAGTSSSADLVGGYMNPYVNDVVEKIRLANQQNIAQNLSPGITAGAVGAGQFGSQRGANALALGISNANIGALGQQAAALQSGYSDALKAAQAQRAAQVSAGQIAGNMATQEAQKFRDLSTNQMNLAKQQQEQGVVDVNQLATMGEQQQKIAQNKELFPLDVLNKQASIFSGAQVPMSTIQTMEGSPLSIISTLGSLGMAAFAPGANTYEPVLDANGKPTFDASGRPITKSVPGASYADRLISWIQGGQKGAAPTPPAKTGTGTGTGTGGGIGGGGAGSDTVASDGAGGFVDTTTGLPVRADGTPLTGTGGGTGGGGAGSDTIASDGAGGYIDTRTGLPVNADGTPIDQSGGEDTTGGYWDENGEWVPT